MEKIEFKQTKVIKNIKKDSGGGSDGLRNAKTNPNDECYTSMDTILTELYHYQKHFKNKKIICPCDWDICEDENVYSIRIDFDKNIHLHTNCHLPEVTLFNFDDKNIQNQRILQADEIENYLNKKVKCNFVRTLFSLGKEWGIRSITASGYNPEKQKGISFEDVDFSKYDICVTNPPFSLYKSFLNKIMTSNIDCILLAPLINRANPLEGEWIQQKKLFLGFNRNLAINFVNPTPENKFHVKNVAVDWITTFDDAQKEKDKDIYKTSIKYEMYKEEYSFLNDITMLDGTHPIKVNVNSIPDDYDGWMFGPISLLDYAINYKKHEFYITNLKGYFNKIHPEQRPTINNFRNDMYSVNGSKGFHGILFRRIK